MLYELKAGTRYGRSLPPPPVFIIQPFHALVAARVANGGGDGALAEEHLIAEVCAVTAAEFGNASAQERNKALHRSCDRLPCTIVAVETSTGAVVAHVELKPGSTYTLPSLAKLRKMGEELWLSLLSVDTLLSSVPN